MLRRQNAVVSTYSNDIVLQSPTSNTNCWLYCNSLLIPSSLSAPAELSSSLDCDDITADVIIADSRSCTSSQLLIVMTSSLLLIASSRIYADVITADSRFLFASIQQLISSTSEHCSSLLNCSSSILLQ
ncbi:hypothetical protein F511_09075 [Dorcoceras hygrometricum]|uniref:Uncharacterized protein n=1 Tax=Dorcoceras hygrometricum TaxID=472368 RepID=A0A2Z7DCQ0_9LAMI|nr:hypothetical protein F511_09075 [Dorcoceras hygrometricum]